MTGQFISVDGEDVPITHEIQKALTQGDLLLYDPATGPDALVYVDELSGRLGLLISDLQVKVGLYPKQVVTCVGSAVSGDGGEGQFEWRDDSEEAEDGTSVIQVGTRSGRWHRISSGGGAGSGDATTIQGAAVSETAPADLQVLQYLSSTGQWTPRDISLLYGIKVYDPRQWGAVADGNSHPLSTIYTVAEYGSSAAALAAAQAVFPFVTSLTEEIDRVAVQHCHNISLVDSIYGSSYKYGGVIYCVGGRWRIDQMIQFGHTCRGGVILGDGFGKTEFVWHGATGASAGPIVQMSGFGNRIVGVTLRTYNTSAGIMAAVRLRRYATGTWIPSQNQLIGCNIGSGGSATNFVDAIAIDSENAPGGSGNNEYHSFTDMDVVGYSRAACYIYGTQVHGIRFHRFFMNGGLVGQYGVLCNYGCYVWFDCGGGGYHTSVDFSFANFHSQSYVKGWNSENSAQWFRVGGTASAVTWPFTIEGCRLESDRLAWDTANNREYAGISLNAGPNRVINNSIYSTHATRRPLISVYSFAADVHLELAGNKFSMQSSDFSDDYQTFASFADMRNALVSTNKLKLTDGGNVYYNVTSGNTAVRKMPWDVFSAPSKRGTHVAGLRIKDTTSVPLRVSDSTLGEFGDAAGFGFAILFIPHKLAADYGSPYERNLISRTSDTPSLSGFRLKLTTGNLIVAEAARGDGSARDSSPTIATLTAAHLGKVCLAWGQRTATGITGGFGRALLGAETAITGYLAPPSGTHLAFGNGPFPHGADSITFLGAATWRGVPTAAAFADWADSVYDAADMTGRIAGATSVRVWSFKRVAAMDNLNAGLQELASQIAGERLIIDTSGNSLDRYVRIDAPDYGWGAV